jgi:hypothetical protein
MLLYDRPTSVYRDVPIALDRPRHRSDARTIELEAHITEDFFSNVVKPQRA